VLKQGDMNDNFYYLHEGLAEVIMETEDFLFFDHEAVKKFIVRDE
jgi:CRP-like cAMP-binding protein